MIFFVFLREKEAMLWDFFLDKLLLYRKKPIKTGKTHDWILLVCN